MSKVISNTELSACLCEDSKGQVCNKTMTKEESDQDGMCNICAGHVYTEVYLEDEYQWEHGRGVL